MAGGSEADVYREYRREIESGRLPRSLRTGTFVFFVIQSVFIGVDRLIYPDLFLQFLPLRLALNVIFAGVYFWTSRTHPLPSAFVMCSAGAAMLIAVTFGTGGASSGYYVGLVLLFMGIGVLLPLSMLQAAVLISALFGAYAAMPLADTQPVDWSVFGLHLFFLAGAGFGGVMGCALLDGMRFADFQQRRALEQARDQLAELDRTKSRFTANVHHELRTPLTLLLAPVEAMLGGDFGELSELQRGYLRTVQVNALRLLKLINNLLDLAKIESQRLELSRRSVDVTRLASDIVAGARPLAERKGIRLEGSGFQGLPVLHADPDALEKILTNLVGNALKFTDAGGRIALHGEAAEGGVHLTVTDTGIGLSGDQLERIFDRFAQADTSATRRHEGTGIGLSLCKELVELHGGRIWAESAGLGRGTTIHVQLPPGTEDVAADEAILSAEDGRALSARQSFEALGAELDLGAKAADDYRSIELQRTVERYESHVAPSSGAAAPEPPPAAPAHAPEILIAEDNPDMRRLLAFLLGREFRVRLARNGREALEAVRERAPELVLTDVMMPEMSGTELCRALKADPATRGIPVMLVTSKAEREMRLEGLELGADDYVSKPFHSRELLARVRSLTRLRVLQEELAERNQELERANAELSAAFAELQQAQAQLVHREKMASVGQLVAGIAHELNNPLSFIQGNLHFLRSYVDSIVRVLQAYEQEAAGSEALRERLRAIRGEHEVDQVLADLGATFEGCAEGVQRTTALVRDLRTFSRLDQPERMSVDLHDALDSTLNLLRGRLRSIRVVREFGDIPPVECLAGQINQVFMNLLANAADAVGERGTIVVRTARVGADSVAVEIEDDGSGIAPETLDRIFDPFFTTKEVGHGTGLGLSISYGIVTRHGGTIGVTSEPGRGSCFRVELPVHLPGTEA